MKVSTVLSLLGFAGLSIAGILPRDEDSNMLEKRCGNYNAISACQAVCRRDHDPVRLCASCGGQPSCQSSCESTVGARRTRCLNCCQARCVTCS